MPKKRYVIVVDGKFLDSEDLPNDPPKRRVRINEIEAEVIIW